MFENCWCGENNYKVIADCQKGEGKFKMPFQIIRCQACGLARNWPKPLSIVDAGQHYRSRKDYLERLAESKKWYKFSKVFLKELKKFKVTGKLLDVGCNVGMFVSYAKKNGYEAQGIDLSVEAIEAGKEALNLKEELNIGTLTDKNYKNQFEIISYLHVLEHIEDLNKELFSIYNSLKEKGILLIAVPNINSIWGRVLGCSWYGCSPKEHIWNFDQKSLKNILEKNNFKIKAVNTRNSMRHDINFSFQGIIKLFLHVVAYLFNSGDNLIIIAEKQ